MKPNDLLHLMTQPIEEIDWYLENVSTKNFVRDLEYMRSRLVDKQLVKDMIDQLKKLL